MCHNCRAECHDLWAVGPPYPEWHEVASGNFMRLVSCPACGQLWLESFYEPFASFRYAVKWPGDRALFEAEQEREQGHALCKWHEAEIRILGCRADAETISHIKAHFERSRGHVNLLPSPEPNPIKLRGA